MTRNNFSSCLRAGFAIAAIVAAFALPTQAFASDCSNANSDATAAQYCPPSAVISGGGGVAGASGSSVSAPSSLPFTGLDVISLLAVAVALGGAGLALRRLSVRGGEQS